MNREILFRGKSLEDFETSIDGVQKGDWVEGYYYFCRRRMCAIIITTLGEESGGVGSGLVQVEIEVDPKTVGQFAGFEDKKGVKGFEGDIVEVVHGTGMEGFKSTRNKKFNCEIIFRDGGFHYKWPKDYGNYRFGQNLKNSKIIGNKFDNPEILS